MLHPCNVQKNVQIHARNNGKHAATQNIKCSNIDPVGRIVKLGEYASAILQLILKKNYNGKLIKNKIYNSRNIKK